MTNRILAAILGLTLLLLPAMCVCPLHAAQSVFAEPGGGVYFEGASPNKFMQWLLLSCLGDETVFELTGGRPLVRPYVEYQEQTP